MLYARPWNYRAGSGAFSPAEAFLEVRSAPDRAVFPRSLLHLFRHEWIKVFADKLFVLALKFGVFKASWRQERSTTEGKKTFKSFNR
jgi:hypothetical protein